MTRRTLRHTETVTVIRRPVGYDPYGDPPPGPTVEIEVDGCAVAPRTSAREGEYHTYDRDALVAGLRIFTPADADIRYTDQVRVRGEVYEVEGEPAPWSSPYSGRQPGRVVMLRRSQG